VSRCYQMKKFIISITLIFFLGGISNAVFARQTRPHKATWGPYHKEIPVFKGIIEFLKHESVVDAFKKTSTISVTQLGPAKMNKKMAALLKTAGDRKK